MNAARRNGKPSAEICYARRMDEHKTALERAFELARSGEYPTVELIKRKIAGEGYSQDQLQGATLRRQLRGLIEAARVTQL